MEKFRVLIARGRKQSRSQRKVLSGRTTRTGRLNARPLRTGTKSESGSGKPNHFASPTVGMRQKNNEVAVDEKAATGSGTRENAGTDGRTESASVLEGIDIKVRSQRENHEGMKRQNPHPGRPL